MSKFDSVYTTFRQACSSTHSSCARRKLVNGWRPQRNGGCHTCAKGIYLYLLASGTLDPATISFRVISDHLHWANHVVVSVCYGDRTWYLDANGINSSHRLLRYWEQEEHLPGAWISDHWNAHEAEDAIPSSGGVALTLADKLLATFGPFSPIWLEKGDGSASGPARTEELRACGVYELHADGQRTGRKAGPFSKREADLIVLALTSLPASVRCQYIVRTYEA